MPNLLRTYQTSATVARDGDRAWRGVSMRLDPGLLPDGDASEAINARFTAGVPETRLGMLRATWPNKAHADGPIPWGAIYGGGLFSDPYSGQDYFIIAAGGSVWALVPHNGAIEIDAPAAVTDPVTFTQAFDRLYMWRGFGRSPWVLRRLDLGFQPISTADPGDGTRPIPNAERALFQQSRLFVPVGDELYASDIGNGGRYLPGVSEFRVNQGSADRLVAVHKFNDTTIVAFKGRSIYALTGVSGDLSAVAQDEITNQYGLGAARAVATVGSDLWFLASTLEVMSLRQTEQNKLQGVTLPVSDPIRPLMQRINGTYAAKSIALYADSKFYLFVPLDEAAHVGPDLVPVEARLGTLSGPAWGYVLTGLTVGSRYRLTWTTSSGSPLVENGTEVVELDGDFVAQDTSIRILIDPSAGKYVPATVQLVTPGVLNAVLVYDFLNRAWSGYDQAAGVGFVDAWVVPVDGRERVLVATVEGWIFLYEEDYEDALTIPYTELLVSAVPAEGLTVRVNGGSAITVTKSNSNTEGANWGCGNPLVLATALTNLKQDSTGKMLWKNSTAPNTFVAHLSNGVRFYATNGLPVSIVLSGSSTALSITQYVTQAVPFRTITRGLSGPTGDLKQVRDALVDIQLWNPTYALKLVAPGVLNTQDLTASPLTESRTEYLKPFDAAAYVATNANADFQTPGRADYSVSLSAADPLSATGAGVPVGWHQERRIQLPANLGGRSVRLQVDNTRGRLRLMQVQLLAQDQHAYDLTRS